MEKNNVYILKNNYYNLDKKGKFIKMKLLGFVMKTINFQKKKT